MSLELEIDARIAADTYFVHTTACSHIRLMNDSRWPWLIVLPRNSDARELHHLSDEQRNAYLNDINNVSHIMHKHTQCRSVNIAMLGNVVAALHCHVVARNTDDPNWPKPVWGFEHAVAYSHKLPDSLITSVQTYMSVDTHR